MYNMLAMARLFSNGGFRADIRVMRDLIFDVTSCKYCRSGMAANRPLMTVKVDVSAHDVQSHHMESSKNTVMKNIFTAKPAGK